MNRQLKKLLGEKGASKFVEVHPGVTEATTLEEYDALRDIYHKTQSKEVRFREIDYEARTASKAVVATKQFSARIEMWATSLHERWYLAYSPELDKLLWRRG